MLYFFIIYSGRAFSPSINGNLFLLIPIIKTQIKKSFRWLLEGLISTNIVYRKTHLAAKRESFVNCECHCDFGKKLRLVFEIYLQVILLVKNALKSFEKFQNWWLLFVKDSIILANLLEKSKTHHTMWNDVTGSNCTWTFGYFFHLIKKNLKCVSSYNRKGK